MKITLFFINWNDSFYLPFIKKHYGKFCSRIVMYDNYSDDDSVAIATNLGMEVRFFGERGILDDRHYLNVKNHCWKEERGISDFVIVCDVDEFLYLNPSTLNYTCPSVTGYQMISENLPVDNIWEIQNGFKEKLYNKQIIFDPNKIQEINYFIGCHTNNKILLEGSILGGFAKLAHMRYIGGSQRFIDRHLVYQ